MRSGTRACRLFGDGAVLVDAADARDARRLAAAIDAARWPGVEDVVGGFESVLVVVDPAVVDPATIGKRVAGLELAGSQLAHLGQSGDAAAGREVRLPVRFGGPDTDDVCAAAGVEPDELARLLAGAVLEVAVVGFSPGFAYLIGLPDLLRSIPRRNRPRPSVPAGSLALAGGYAAVYPQSTPGGWQLVGHTARRLFDASRPPFALLQPGDTVRFDPVSPADVAGTIDAVATAVGSPGDRYPTRPPFEPPAGVPTALVVEDPGLLTLVEDGGRRGVARLGVPAAGPADPVAHALANRLVGNPADAAALEMTAAGPTLRCVESGYLAVVGGDPVVTVDGYPVDDGHVVPLVPGQQVAVGRLQTGLRAYLAWAGGVVVPEVLGSRSTDLLVSLGPGRLQAGDRLGAGPVTGLPADRLEPDGAVDGARDGDAVVLRVLPGPHPDRFAPTVLDELAATPMTVDDSSDRIGLRLDGQVRRAPGELASLGMVTGAIQVPPDGRPVVLGPDHATLGGYPVAAVVITADRWKLGQCRPGDRVRFVPVTAAEAVAARATLDRSMASAVVGRYPTEAG
ncbi:MAG TPA: 5-oxoprolinase/urea amidolyase family protein [Acidimicrobiales bacterium]